MLLYNHMCLLIWTVFSGEQCGPWASCLRWGMWPMGILFSKLKWAFLIACRTFVCLWTFHIFFFFSRTTWPFSTKLGLKHPLVMRIQVCSNKGPQAFPRGDNKKKWKYDIYKNLLLKDHWANFNQTWHKSYLGDGDANLFK